ncbi:MAG: polysaccharide deacetylase family protein [Verrucomicrobiales bacterium]|nr:polysaccharide deacetylase family protein [Verrucomicrobiales bacterium]
MTRSEFLKIMAAGALGAGVLSRLASRALAQPAGETAVSGSAVGNAATQPWQPVPVLQAEPPSPTRFASSGPGLGNRIAITFDDGPTPGVTEIVLKELDKRKIRASFFMIGRNAERFPSLAKEVADAGHEICNHTYTHPQLSALPAAKAQYEIQKAQEVITAATGHAPKWLRPPYGAFRRKDQGILAQQLGLGVIWWSVDPRDWSQPGVGQIINRVVSATLPGSVILCHDLHPQTAQAVGIILDQLQEKDYNFTNVSGFLGEPYGPYFG